MKIVIRGFNPKENLPNLQNGVLTNQYPLVDIDLHKGTLKVAVNAKKKASLYQSYSLVTAHIGENQMSRLILKFMGDECSPISDSWISVFRIL